MDGQLIAMFDGADDLVDIGDGEPRVDTLAEQIERQSDDVDIAGALTIAEQRPFDPFRPRHHGEIGGGDRGAAVVMRMHAEDYAIAVADVAAKPLDLVGIDIWRRH